MTKEIDYFYEDPKYRDGWIVKVFKDGSYEWNELVVITEKEKQKVIIEALRSYRDHLN